MKIPAISEVLKRLKIASYIQPEVALHNGAIGLNSTAMVIRARRCHVYSVRTVRIVLNVGCVSCVFCKNGTNCVSCVFCKNGTNCTKCKDSNSTILIAPRCFCYFSGCVVYTVSACEVQT